MELIAHSTLSDRPKNAPHYYVEHVQDMLSYGIALFDYVLNFSRFSKDEKQQLRETMKAAIMLHDLGKLDDENQTILHGKKKGKLPIDHIDAGTAAATKMGNELLAWLIRGHHAPGLVSKTAEENFCRRLKLNAQFCVPKHSLRGKRHCRDSESQDDYVQHKNAILKTDERLEDYIRKHKSVCGSYPEIEYKLPETSLTTRMLLSCLVDADHESTSAHSCNAPMKNFNPAFTRWEGRLKKLNDYVCNLDLKPYELKNTRNQLRDDFYQRCFTGELYPDSRVMCSAPVGLGKTTSIAAYLLRKAIQTNASRMIIIAPFTNIINQTVDVLRKAIVLEGEVAEKTVVAHHHKVDFSGKEMRQYAASWEAPIIVTTAVQFFETMASAYPSTLKKLHSIAGATIFIDESHACLPPRYLSIAWHWLKKLTDDWGCQIVCSSGSTVAFWNDHYLVGEGNTEQLRDIVEDSTAAKLTHIENNRISFKRIEKTLTKNEFIENILSSSNLIASHLKPSILIVVNTVQTAAYVAHALLKKAGDSYDTELCSRRVLHISTGLTPNDRDCILEEVKRRQGNSEWNTKAWFLVATSCVEAGVDLDFSIGYRERCSLTSFLQVAGRINRHGTRNEGSNYLYDVSLHADGKEIIAHPGFEDAIIVFEDIWDELIRGTTDITTLVTRSLRKEFNRKTVEYQEQSLAILEQEEKNNFQEVMQNMKIINTETVTVIVNSEIQSQLERGCFVDWQKIQNDSVQLWLNKVKKWNLQKLKNCQNDDIYSWLDKYEYDNFLGVFAGIVKSEQIFKEFGGVV
jgi:CRISPR-associated endonuclease/helicase Cas3